MYYLCKYNFIKLSEHDQGIQRGTCGQTDGPIFQQAFWCGQTVGPLWGKMSQGLRIKSLWDPEMLLGPKVGGRKIKTPFLASNLPKYLDFNSILKQIESMDRIGLG
jgi:hypothetical protein